MSDTDSFIEEVTEEVRRDRLFLMLKRYGWIGVVAILVIVGGASYREYTKSQEQAQAQALGDALIGALAANDAAGRADALGNVATEQAGSAAIAGLLAAGALAEAGDTEKAVAKLKEVALLGEVPQIYRNIATFKALLLQSDTLSVAERRLQFESLATPGAPLRLLSEEQLALLDISEGQSEAAIDRLQAIIVDSEASSDLKQRASQVIVALGGTPAAAS
ncbi:tetratricopeptide repeat protein [Aliisedimentitalea scapharcae]|uniref:Tetratricopeptide repeat protein n=1 Tax=Aliisedimentitalea scapharcae TaxID=1524259 RepID=A0ABZ2XX57_9RHOB|nr:tetratricopeptide repeat protein [Rhodobacteraceae bacterium M382]